VPNSIFQDLGIKKLGYLPKRDLEMKARAPNAFENTDTAIVNAGYMSGRNGDKKSTNHFINQKGND